MNEQARRTLKRLIGQYGTDLASDPRRTEALLNDLCGRHRREIFVLVNAQKQRVPEEMLAAPRWMPADTLRARLERRLQEKLALTEDAAQWAVESWALALEPTSAGRDLSIPWPSSWVSKTTRIKGAVTQKAKPKASPSPTKRQSERHGVQSGGSATAIGDEDSSKKSRNSRRRRREKRAKPSKQRKERSALALPFLWMGALGVGLALAWVLAAGSMPQTVTADPNSSPGWWGWATGLSLEEPKHYLAQAYPPSRAAWVSEGPLLIRSGPSTENEYLGMLEAGAGVLVEDYSTDAEWSRLSQPKQGWVSNQFLNFLSETEPSTAIFLGVRLGYVARENVVLLPAPESDLALQDSLPVGTSVIAIAVTIDNQWIQIAEPTAGWLQAEEVRFADE